MSIADAIKNSVLEGFATSITVTDIVFGMGCALVASLFILFIYQRTTLQTTLNRSFCLSLLLVCSISSMMVLTITSNLALSLGMVGALSIIRFRTAIKDASDTAFLFWAVAAGITSGAGFYLLTLVGCLFVGAVCVVSLLLFDRISKPFLLVVRVANSEAADQVDACLRSRKLRYSLSSRVQNKAFIEVIYEVGIEKKEGALVSIIQAIEGVNTVSLVDCRKS